MAGALNRTGSSKRDLFSISSILLSHHLPFLSMVQQARASHILVKTEDEANRIMKRINDGEDFAAVAKRFSSCPSRKDGGDLGWFGKGQMVPEFEKVAFENDPGKIVGPVKTQFGYHVIKVTGRK
jgi:peptidyl-prolyl cis-trans isomerase C